MPPSSQSKTCKRRASHTLPILCTSHRSARPSSKLKTSTCSTWTSSTSGSCANATAILKSDT
eukprot:168642-Pleurochrysis_carterae.AAC.1